MNLRKTAKVVFRGGIYSLEHLEIETEIYWAPLQCKNLESAESFQVKEEKDEEKSSLWNKTQR